MSGPRGGARPSPYEIGTPGRAFRERVFGEIREEAGTSGADLADPGAFLRLEATGSALRELCGDSGGGIWGDPFGAFIFHAFHFWVAGERLYSVGEGAARSLAASPPESFRWQGELPAVAGYVQLPIHLFWSPAGEEGSAEPVDGFFWTQCAGRTLSLLVAMGIRRNRPGFSLTELPPAGMAGAGEWPCAQVREEGEDFAPVLPGGDLGRLHSILTLGEMLKLAARIFFASVSGEEPPLASDRTAVAGSGLEGSAPPFRRIRFSGPGAPGRPDPKEAAT